jgi:hypothetical protein
MKYITTLVLLYIVSAAQAQYEEGIVRVTEESSIRQLLDHRKALNFQKDRHIKVWSVQLFLSRDKYLATKKVNEIKQRTRYLNSEVDWFYEAPYYRVYSGGFYTKLEAASLLSKVVDLYPDAILFKNTEAKPMDMP